MIYVNNFVTIFETILFSLLIEEKQ